MVWFCRLDHCWMKAELIGWFPSPDWSSAIPRASSSLPRRSWPHSGSIKSCGMLTRKPAGRYQSTRCFLFASSTLTRDCCSRETKESDFVSRSSNAVSGSSSAGAGGMSGGGASSPSHSAANSTLNRPMSSQGGTRYEDKTLSLQRSNTASANNNGQANRQQAYRVSTDH